MLSKFRLPFLLVLLLLDRNPKTSFRLPSQLPSLLVLLLEAYGRRVLLPSDIGPAGELALLERADLGGSLLKLAAQKAKGSTSGALLDAVAPPVAVMPAAAPSAPAETVSNGRHESVPLDSPLPEGATQASSGPRPSTLESWMAAAAGAGTRREPTPGEPVSRDATWRIEELSTTIRAARVGLALDQRSGSGLVIF